MATVVSLAALGEAKLEVYMSLFAVEYFACYALFRPRRRVSTDVIGATLFLVFCYIVALKVWEILF